MGFGGTFLRRSQLGSSMLWKLFSSISPSHTCSPIPTRQLGFPRQFLLGSQTPTITPMSLGGWEG